MGDYIRKEDAKDALQEKVFHNLTDEFYGAMQAIDELPSADVVQVVRCKDCKHNINLQFDTAARCNLWGCLKPKRGFCDAGKRREE